MLPGWVIWNETIARQENVEYEQLAACVAMMQLLANYVCVEDNPKMAVGIHCGSKDRRFFGH